LNASRPLEIYRETQPGAVLFDAPEVEQVRESKKSRKKIPASLASRGDFRIKRRCPSLSRLAYFSTIMVNG
jgi:hypothetical protein